MQNIQYKYYVINVRCNIPGDQKADVRNEFPHLFRFNNWFRLILPSPEKYNKCCWYRR